MTIQELITTAKRLSSGVDPSLAVYILRDTDEVRMDPDLHSLAWVLSSGHCVRCEAVWFIQLLESKLAATAPVAPVAPAALDAGQEFITEESDARDD